VPDYSVQRLIEEEIPIAFWKNDEAYKRMTEVDANGELTYQPDPENPMYLGYGIVCTGVNMWDPTGSDSCTCCKGKEAPIFLGLEAMKVCMGAIHPEVTGHEAISHLHKALSPLMRHTDITGHKQPEVVNRTKALVHVHELGVYTRLYTSPAMQHRFQYLIDVAQFQEYTATWAWFLWNFRSLKGDHKRFVDQMTTTWSLYRAVGKKEWRQYRSPPSDPNPASPHGQHMTDADDTYVRDIRSVCGSEMEVGTSVYKILKEADLLPEST
jgi:hypothetical protein